MIGRCNNNGRWRFSRYLIDAFGTWVEGRPVCYNIARYIVLDVLTFIVSVLVLIVLLVVIVMDLCCQIAGLLCGCTRNTQAEDQDNVSEASTTLPVSASYDLGGSEDASFSFYGYSPPPPYTGSGIEPPPYELVCNSALNCSLRRNSI
ncbi:hypothetical protein FDZ58_04140 [Ehrlichia ruminantium]|uniref:Uncharacterized protein n=1 Tax=Ehrlichia ruminantium (strain Welgevonden) TaxID=254945 RepID=A0A0H3M0L3_EHRRW|nr:hypothetical protein [Ehrlichia ruminantium]KYW98307.1 hypothetical protein AUR40_05285 [Ehrlichia ruminantium]QLK53581.1 hypothetical protein FDZ64_04140 [Ehrlichia ruminantium]QLK55419.1 hypothetical protein FDZ62_04145 [Ehrlichia ruminantium]QLK56335.1 hypothetical protein FDZ61_04140 [Ehrlichia ruminantium]QLK59075.1 hypothetical protein FDZ58_04140 [Ehrlichia ruminantium]